MGCSTCAKCKWVRNSAFCGTTKLTEKQLYAKNGFCSEYEQKVIRCKDCKHRPVKPDDYENGFSLEFPDTKCPCQCSDGWYSWYPDDDWYCANGELS